MADSLLDQLKGLVTPEIVARVGGALGESEENVAKGFGAAAPALLSGLVSRATEGQGAERILSLVNDSDNDGSILSNTESLLSDTVATTPLHGLGQTLMGGLLSGKSEEVAEGVAEESGLQKASALKILGFLSPLLLGLLGKNLGPGAAPASLLELVTAQKDGILSALSGGLADKLGGIINLGALSSVAAAAPAVAVVEDIVPTTAASSVVGGLGSVAVAATPVIPTPEVEPIVEPTTVEVEPPAVDVPSIEPEPVAIETVDTVVVETPVVEESIVEASVVEESIVEPVVVEPVVVAVEPVEDIAPVVVSVPEVPEEPVEAVAPVFDAIEIPEPTVPEEVSIVPVDEPVELPEPAVAVVTEAAEAVAEPVVFEPVEEVAEVAAEVPSVEIADEDTVPFPEAIDIDTPEEVDTPAIVETAEAVEEVYTPPVTEPEVTIPEAVEPYEPAVEETVEAVDADTIMESVEAPVEAVDEAVSTARAAINDASEHIVGSANVMLKPEPGPGIPRWLLPVVAIVVLGGIAYYFLKVRNQAPPAPKPGVTAPSNTNAGPEASAEVKLPDGKAFKALPGGTEEKLVAFLQDSSKPVDDTTWFDFDRVTFEAGKGSLKPESRPQIENIVAVLNAFPNASVKIGGYTDNSGVKDVNLKLSGARATAVMKAITGRDIAPDRIEAEGYGDQNPACAANDTEECREKNRRVAIRVTKK